MNEPVLLSAINLTDLTSNIERSMEKLLEKALARTVDEKLLSIEEVRKMFVPTISKSSIVTYTKQGKLRSYWLGGKLVYRRSELLQDITKIRNYSLKTTL
jgi:hypothetical protein